MYLEPGLCLCKLLNVAGYLVSQTTCVIWIVCEMAIWAVTSHETKGRKAPLCVLAADKPSHLTDTSVLNI